MLRLSGSVLMGCLALAACSTNGPPSNSVNGPSAADCANAVRYEGVRYMEVGFSDQPTESLGEAEMSICEDSGADARGMVFPTNPDAVPVSRFQGFNPADVVAFDSGGGPVRVMISDDVTGPESKPIIEQLVNDNDGG